MSGKTIHVGNETIELPAVKMLWINLAVIGIAGLWLIFSTIYTVGADEVGVIRVLVNTGAQPIPDCIPKFRLAWKP